ncbi:MAG: SDR family oxidoreductase [Planctomycetota bacterium]
MNDKTPVEASKWLPPGTFDGQRVVVTGGGTGLGLEISRGFADLGASVAILSRSPEHHTELLDEARLRGWNVHSFACDVREHEAVARAAEEATRALGGVDILVNNAAGNFVCPTERLSANAWRAVLGIVLDGTFYCSRDFGKVMIAAGGGQIFNVVATYAWTGMPGVVHSASAKAGVLTMTKTLAAEWARFGIRANAIAPGPFESAGSKSNLWPENDLEDVVRELVPLGRFATTSEVAAQCLWVMSPASVYMTGECIVLDGGISLPKTMWEPGARVKREKE